MSMKEDEENIQRGISYSGYRKLIAIFKSLNENVENFDGCKLTFHRADGSEIGLIPLNGSENTKDIENFLWEKFGIFIEKTIIEIVEEKAKL